MLGREGTGGVSLTNTTFRARGESRYTRVLDAMDGDFKKERNKNYEVFQLLSRKQRIGESLEQFHAVPSGLAARCSFGTLEARVLRDVFIVNIALSYERGDKYAKSYVTTGDTASSSTGGGEINIKSEPAGVIRGGYRNSRGRGRRQAQGRGSYRGGSTRCCNCDKPGFIREHIT